MPRHRFPAEIISGAVSLYFPFPLSLRMVRGCWRHGASLSAMRPHGNGRRS